MKQEYLVSAEIQAKIVPNPARISSFKMASSLSKHAELNEIKFSVRHFEHEIVVISLLFSLREDFSYLKGPPSFYRLSFFLPSSL